MTQKSISRNSNLNHSLNKAQALYRIAQSEDYQQTLLPALAALSQIQPRDPREYPNREEFSRQVEIDFARASAFAEIIELLNIDKIQNGIKAMTKTLKEGDKSYHIGGSQDARHTRKPFTPTT